MPEDTNLNEEEVLPTENEKPEELEPPVPEEEEVEVPEEEEVEVPEEEEDEPKKEKKPRKAKKPAPVKKPKPEKGKGRQEKGKGAEKGFSKGKAWWKENGTKMQKQGHSQRNIIMKAAREAGAPFDRAVMVMREKGTVEEKVLSLFNS